MFFLCGKPCSCTQRHCLVVSAPSEFRHYPQVIPSSADTWLEVQESQTAVQLAPAISVPAPALVEKHDPLIHTSSMPSANSQPKQERQVHLLQSQLEGHKLRANDFEKQCEHLTAELDYTKQRHSASGHRHFQVPAFSLLYAVMQKSHHSLLSNGYQKLLCAHAVQRLREPAPM